MLFSKTIIFSFLAAATAVSAYGGERVYERDVYARDAYAEAEASEIEFLQEIMRRSAGRKATPMDHVLTCHMSQCDSACECDSKGKVQCNGATVVGQAISAAQMTTTCRGNCHC